MLIEKTGKIINNCGKGWKWTLPKEASKLEKVGVVLTHSWKGYPLPSTCCLRTEILLKGLDEFLWTLLCPPIGEDMFIHFSLCMFGEQYYFMEEDTVMYRVIEGSLSHRKTKQKDYICNVKFAKSRYDIYEKLPYSEDKQREVKKVIFNYLFNSSAIY
ncbi:MAG: hypothetical protein LBE13_10625 [Bacteroidales bacterium]|jgi:hypothetical protein|nr:hypothetical protein [Bacteroidales bacterium]